MPDLLLVDNDRRIVELAAWFLERRGYVVRSALSYRDARVAIRERAPDLMLADLELGDENGREELPRLLEAGLLPRTLVVSGFLDAALDAELRELAPVVGTLAKPYDMNGLEARIEECLGTELPAASGQAPEECLPRPAISELGEPGTEAEAPLSVTPEPAGEENDDEGWVEIVPFRRGAEGGA